jgi:uncharacterized protein (TIGR02145 family)
MNCFTFKKLGRTLLLAAVTAVGAVCWLGCGDDNGANSGGGGSNETVTIGGVKWTKKNLNVKTEESIGGKVKSMCYDDKAANCNKYGRLYNWSAAMSACKSIGMRLPDREDWADLGKAVGGSSAGKKLKAKSGWVDHNGKALGNGTDDYGFSALPGGRCEDGVVSSGCAALGQFGGWWTATDKSYDAYTQTMYSIYDDVRNENEQMSDVWLSVRCIKD